MDCRCNRVYQSGDRVRIGNDIYELVWPLNFWLSYTELIMFGHQWGWRLVKEEARS
jgi:hypothetical protein